MDRLEPFRWLNVDVKFWHLLRRQPVGRLWVEDAGTQGLNQRVLIEHWGLYKSFKSPSELNKKTALYFEYKEGEIASVDDFKDELRRINSSNPRDPRADVRYICATCVDTTL